MLLCSASVIGKAHCIARGLPVSKAGCWQEEGESENQCSHGHGIKEMKEG